MTREEAIARLKEIDIRDALQEDYDALYVAIEALEQEPCSDAISRQAVLDLAKKGVLVSNGNYESVCKAINELPPGIPLEPKTGHWIDHDKHIECDKCRTWFLKDYLIRKSFCPNCGCRMVEPKESEEKE